MPKQVLPNKRFFMPTGIKKWGGGPKMQKKKKNQNRGTRMFDFKIGRPKSPIL
jgi:hypothetical protein